MFWLLLILPLALVLFLKKQSAFALKRFHVQILLSLTLWCRICPELIFKRQREGDCKAPGVNRALVSATTSEEHFDAVEELGCNFFKKPFKLVEIVKWIEECAKRFPDDRILAELGWLSSYNVLSEPFGSPIVFFKDPTKRSKGHFSTSAVLWLIL